ncbi:MAG: 1-acyl-sn-glycerol-3-phosphate acyltransferase [Oscillospiraceae bacterium]|nr:1-acyl-sn-glycerol-3-phosphate acyltransferase [Oscillospiraceae bacterium]
MSVFGSLQNSFVARFFKRLFRVRIINPENEPLESEVKSYVACINHSSNWDPILIGACMHRPLRYMAKAELFKVPVLKSIVKLFGAYPVKRDTADVSSVKASINMLENGEVVGMYPQGHRAKKIPPEKITPKSGVAMVAYKAKVGILPITIISKGYKVRAFRKTIVVFGKYIPFEQLEEMAKTETKEDGAAMGNIELYQKITERVYGEILENYKKHDTLNKRG